MLSTVVLESGGSHSDTLEKQYVRALSSVTMSVT